MLNSYLPKNFFVAGPAGKLETTLAELDSKSRKGIAVIAHPHPLYGGSMDNKVVHTLFKALYELGFTVVKFNFRGVGNSEGVFDRGVGEVEDVVSIVKELRKQFDMQCSLPLLLAGFSFGGAVQAHVAQSLKPQTLVLVAPSVEQFSAPAISTVSDKSLIIHGDQDEVVLLKTILSWATPQNLPVLVIPGAEHFFHGKLHILKRAILDSCQS